MNKIDMKNFDYHLAAFGGRNWFVATPIDSSEKNSTSELFLIPKEASLRIDNRKSKAQVEKMVEEFLKTGDVKESVVEKITPTIFRHIRPRLTLSGEIWNLGGITIAAKINYTKGIISMGVSICTFEDNFVATEGREKSELRLNTKPIEIPYQKELSIRAHLAKAVQMGVVESNLAVPIKYVLCLNKSLTDQELEVQSKEILILG